VQNRLRRATTGHGAKAILRTLSASRIGSLPEATLNLGQIAIGRHLRCLGADIATSPDYGTGRVRRIALTLY
jgi:hypothetical protein